MMDRQQHVYFIRPIGMDGPVKIGFSNLPERRLLDLLAWSPFPLEIVCTIPGGMRLEGQFHARFFEHHSHREWFRINPDLTAVMASIKAGTFDISTLPPTHNLTSRGRKWSSAQRAQMLIYWGLRRLEKAGVGIPEEIDAARKRFSLYGVHYTQRFLAAPDPADADIVLGFIRQNEPA